MEALDYLRKIEREGYEAYIVGGYVRDKLLGKSTTDVDITTNATPKEVAKIFDLPSLGELGCVNIKCSDINVDITTYRKESKYLKHRPNIVTYVDDLLTDLKRRDFTINTICMDSNGEIIDLLNGKKDLENKVLKVVGNVKKKFTEDPLRMLRALRLSIIYDLEINESELIFILNNKELFKSISYERKKQELGKILVSTNCIKGLNLLKTLGLLEYLDIGFGENIVYVEDYIGMWVQLRYSPKYPFTKVENSRLKNMRAILKYGKIDKFVIFKYGTYDAKVCACILGINKDEVDKIYNDMQIHSKGDLIISGKKIKDILQVGNDPIIRTIKKDLIKEILRGNLSNDENILTNYIIEKWK